MKEQNGDRVIDFVYNNKMEKFTLVLALDIHNNYTILEIYDKNNKCIDGIFLDAFQEYHSNALTQIEELKNYIDKVINN